MRLTKIKTAPVNAVASPADANMRLAEPGGISTAHGYYVGDTYYEKVIRPNGRVEWFRLDD